MDYSELVARLRASCDVREAALLRNLAADALEAQGRELALTEYERDLSRRSLAQVEARLAEAEALLREAGTTIERLVDAVEEYGGWDDDGRADYATHPIRDRIDAFLTPPPARGPGE